MIKPVDNYIGARELAKMLGIAHTTAYRYENTPPEGWPRSRIIQGRKKWHRKEVAAYIERLENGDI